MQIAWAGQLVGAVRVRQVMRFRIGAGQGPVTRIPDRLRGGPGLPPLLPPVTSPRKVRTATLNTGLMRHFRNVSTLMMNINNLRWSDPGFDTPEQGTEEQWHFVNCDALFQVHAMHVHLVQFRVLDRQVVDVPLYIGANPPPPLGHRWAPSAARFLRGRPAPPAPYERGWKDTVRCPPGTVTRVAVRWPTAEELGFDPDAAFPGSAGEPVRGYVWHCHLLDHEDHEMMLPLRIVRSGQGSRPAPAVSGMAGMSHRGHELSHP